MHQSFVQLRCSASFSDVSITLESAVLQWEDGYARLQRTTSHPSTRRALDRAVTRIRAGLRRRLGSTFTVSELAKLYYAGTDWCLEIVLELAPQEAPLPDPAAATDSAFYLYMREASDFAGGRVLANGH